MLVKHLFESNDRKVHVQVQVLVLVILFAKDGTPKLVPECAYPLTGFACVDRVYTDYAVFDLGPDGAVVTETFGVTYDELSSRLDAPLRRASSDARMPGRPVARSPGRSMVRRRGAHCPKCSGNRWQSIARRIRALIGFSAPTAPGQSSAPFLKAPAADGDSR